MAHILFVDMHANTSLSRLPRLFQDVGVQCSGLAFDGKILLQTNALDQRFYFPEGALVGSMQKMAGALARALQACNADFLISNDEVFIKNLLNFRRNLRSGGDNLNPSQLALRTLLERSLLKDDTLYDRARSLEVAQEAGFPTPKNFTVDTPEKLQLKLEEFGYPLYLKRNFEGGGVGVSLISNEAELNQLLNQYSETNFLIEPRSPILVQKPASGLEFTVNFCSWNGELLGYDVIQPLEKTGRNGPSTVVQTVYRPAWEDAIRTLVKRLHYTGFGGLDVFEKTPQTLPDVIEVNMRPASSLQVSDQLNSSLIQRFAARLKNSADAQAQGPAHRETNRIATLFPDELFRDKNSQYAVTTPSNIPWDDPKLLAIFLRKLNIISR